MGSLFVRMDERMNRECKRREFCLYQLKTEDEGRRRVRGRLRKGRAKQMLGLTNMPNRQETLKVD